MPLYAGLDWAKAEHALCVVDDSGAVRLKLSVSHTAEGLSQMVSALRRLPESPRIAIERPSGLLVDTLVEAGFQVVPIHPNVVKATRPRYRAAGGKSDPGDAYLLADLLRTDGHRFRPVAPLSDESRALRALVRTRDDLVAERVALANQLRALLESFWPGAAVLFADVDSPIALAFLGQYPTPQSAARLGPKRLAAFLARNSYCGRRSVEELQARLRSAPSLTIGEAETEAKGNLVRALVAILGALVQQLQGLTAEIEHAVSTHTDAAVMLSFPRIGRVNAAQILAELGHVSRFASEQQLAAEAGVAPVTSASGKQRAVTFRWACNKRLRRALTCWADNSRHASTWALSIYSAARTRGCDHPHAVRILARAWTRVLWQCLANAQPYQVEKHRAAAKLAA